MRIDEATKRVINMLAGEMQRETGRTISFNEALWELLRLHRPDLTEQAVRMINAEQDGH